MSIRITCIKKANGQHENAHVAISSLGWINEITSEKGSSTRVQMYDYVNGGGSAFVKDAWGDKAYLKAHISPAGTKYVKTVADNTMADNLLKLPECP